jgi:hypothetical protein
MIRSRVRWAGRVARHAGFWWEHLKERDNREDLDLGKSDIKMDISEVGWGGVD